MLKFFYGTDQYKLADRLISECHHSPGTNPLEPEIFMVQNNGMGQWLSLYMAEKKGIAANLEFEFPSERIWSLIRLLDPSIPEQLPSDRGPLTWSIMRLLEDDKTLSRFENLHSYIKAGPTQQEMRRWKLSTKIADVFDQYLIYRPELIRKWEADEQLYDQNEAEIWQKELWNMLTSFWQENYEGAWLHRSQLQDKLLDALQHNRLDVDQLPERISVFGVSSMPAIFTEILIGLSQFTEVHFYQFAMDPEVISSEDFTNPLLQSLAKQGTDLMTQFRQHIRPGIEIEGPKKVDATEPTLTSLLGQVQLDIKNDRSDIMDLSDHAMDDPSLQVHSCHSPMREVQVLYDQLLALLDDDPELFPDEILIMTPDIQTYAPVIKAVFGTPDDGQPAIPYSIAERGIKGEYPAVESFLQILELCESRFKVTEVLNLLDADPIRTVFDFTDADLNRIEQWIKDNNIRWGVDGEFKSSFDLPKSDSFTWQSGLQRMLLGYGMNPDDRLYENVFPYHEIEGTEDAALVGRFTRLLQSLFKIQRSASTPASPEEWGQMLSHITADFLPDNENYYGQISKIRSSIDKLTADADLGGFESKVPFSVIRLWMQEQLEQQTTGGGRIGRGVTFSSLNPMRSIPFKVIGVIGMNEGSFPRSKIPIEFDLMHSEPTEADPDQAKEDRFLFLENLMLAKHYLYFSYVGQSDRQDSQFPPSVVLKEFLDYLQQQYDIPTDDLIVNHRLQPFSPSYFKDGKKFSYSRKQLKVSQQLLESKNREEHQFVDELLPEPDKEWKQLSVNNLIRFFQHPAKFLLQKRLGIYHTDQDMLTDDREPFQLDKLEEYKVGQELLGQFLKGQLSTSYEQMLQARDLLPVGWRGHEFYRKKMDEVREFGQEIQQQIENQEPLKQEVDCKVDDFRVVGSLDNIYPKGRISYRFGRARAKDKIGWWIRHLLFQRVKPEGHSGKSFLFTWEDADLKEYCLSPETEVDALLSDLLQLYWSGLQQPLPFYAKSSYAFAKTVLKKGKDVEKGISKAENKWAPAWKGASGEGEDFYNALVTDGTSPFQDDRFMNLAQQFWAPFFELENQGGD